MTDFITNLQGTVFVQTDPLRPYELLTTVGLDDVEIPGRESTPVYEPDPRRSGEMVVAGFLRGNPGPVTTTLTRPLARVYNFLLEYSECPMNVRVNWSCGDRGICNYFVGQALIGATLGARGVAAPVALSDEESRVNTTAQISAPKHAVVYPVTAGTVDVGSTRPIHDVVFLPERCAQMCGPAVPLGRYGFMVCGANPPSYLESQMLYTLDGGGTWQAAATEPFADTDIMCAAYADLPSGVRIVVGADGEVGAEARVAYTDDLGASWTVVELGTASNVAVNRIVRDQLGNFWAVCSNGDMYVSRNLGVSWESVTSGVSNALYDIAFRDSDGIAVGASNTVLVSHDSGTTWSSITGPAAGSSILSVAYNSAGLPFVATSAGGVWVLDTRLGVSQWQSVFAPGGSIPRLRFDDHTRHFGFLVCNISGVGYIYRTEDGGITWNRVYTPSSGTFNGTVTLDHNRAYAFGDSALLVRIAPGG